MSQAQLQQIVDMFRSGGLDLSGPVEQTRAMFEGMMDSVPAPENMAFDSATVGGVGGLWCRSKASSNQRVLLYLHGGAYVFGSSRTHRVLASALAAAAGVQAFVPDYRLAPEHPFPAAVEDGLAAYRGLLSQGYSPREIAVAGDSAGGGLTISLLLAIRQAQLPMPAAAAVLSPWTDLACAGGSMTDKAAHDPVLKRDGLLHLANMYRNGDASNDTGTALLQADLGGLPPLLIQVGSNEILLDDSVRLAAHAGAAGVRTQLEIWPAMFHVWHTFGFMLSEGSEAIAGVGAFLASHYGTARGQGDE
jgi:monoterpene epsilon-lactone hydrolase